MKLDSFELWRKLFCLGGVFFQVIFLLELFLFFDDVVVDPSVHRISYENWNQVVTEWNTSGFWAQNAETIIEAVKLVNIAFQLFFVVALTGIFIKNESFSVSRRWLVLGYLLVALLSAMIQYYIKYHADFYRLYMYSIFNEMVATYLIWLTQFPQIARRKHGAAI